MSKKSKDDGYTLGTIEMMLNAKPSTTSTTTKKSRKRKPKEDTTHGESTKSESPVPKKRGRKKKTTPEEAPEGPKEPSKTTKPVAKKKGRKKKASTVKVKDTVPPKTEHAPAKVYDLQDAKTEEDGDTNTDPDVILQLPLTEEDIETYSLKNKEINQQFLVNQLLEYNPYIAPFNPKPTLQRDKGEEGIEYSTHDEKSIFRPCIKCVITVENSVIPCEDCAKKFDTRELVSVDDALLKRAEDDALYCRPDPTKFRNEKIVETKLPADMKIEEYNPDVITEFSNEPSPFVHGKIGFVEEVHQSPFEQTYVSRVDMNLEDAKDTPRDTHVPQSSQSQHVMSTPIGSAPVEEITTTKQFRILNEFTQLEKWPKRTNVYCWWDCHPFNGVPVAVPIRYNKKADTFMVYGCFCSFECAMAYKKGDRKLCRISNDLFYDLRKRYGQLNTKLDKDQLSQLGDTSSTFATIRSAMPRKSLSIFGGKLSIQEFRKYSCMTTLSTKVYQFPMIPVNEIIEIVPKKYKNLELNRSSSPPLKLKRTKPLPGSKNTLEHTLLSHSRKSSERKSPKKKAKTK